MTTLKIGIASYEEMKARTMAVARGQLRVARNAPKVWFTSTESFAKVLSAGNRDLLRVACGKGGKGRYTLPSPTLLEFLRAYVRAFRPRTWLFGNNGARR